MSGVRVVAGAASGLVPLLLVLAGCQGSDPQPLEPISIDRFAGPDSLVAGGGASGLLAYTSHGAAILPALRLVRHDAARPGTVEQVGDVSFPSGTRFTRLHVGADAVAVVIPGAVLVVDPSAPALTAERSFVSGAVDAAVSGRWVAAAVDRGVVLLSRDAPHLSYPLAASSTPTGLQATAIGFLAFTATGYLVVDTTGPEPRVQEVSDPVLRDLRGGAVAGGVALVAGPGASSERSRVLRLDLSDPAAPAVVHAVELAGAYVDLAWDGQDTAVLAVHGPGDDDRPETFHQGYLLRETSGGFQVAGLPLPFWSLSVQPLAAHAGHLLAVQSGGAALLRIR